MRLVKASTKHSAAGCIEYPKTMPEAQRCLDLEIPAHLVELTKPRVDHVGVLHQNALDELRPAILYDGKAYRQGALPGP